MARGGKRPGAGKPKGFKHQRTLEREAARAYISERVRSEIEPIVTAQIEAAKGIFVMFGKVGDEWTRVTDPDTMLRCLQSGNGFYRIAQTGPNIKALQGILDREFGRPTEHVEVTGADGQPLTFSVSYGPLNV